MKIRLAICTLAFLLFGTGCANLHKPAQKNQPVAATLPVPAPKLYWDDAAAANATGAPSIQISLSEQRACFYKGKTLIGVSVISSGKKGFETPPGQYRVIQKDLNHVSNLYGDYVDENGDIVKKNVDVTKDPQPEGTEFRGAKMSYFLRFTGGYGMHAGLLPGYRASHGCVRLPRVMAKHFYENAEFGTEVIVTD